MIPLGNHTIIIGYTKFGELMKSLKDHIRGEATFQYYFDNSLWYKTDSGLEFPIPISDTVGAKFLAKDKASYFMRWIRKWLEVVSNARKEQDM